MKFCLLIIALVLLCETYEALAQQQPSGRQCPRTNPAVYCPSSMGAMACVRFCNSGKIEEKAPREAYVCSNVNPRVTCPYTSPTRCLSFCNNPSGA